MNKFFIFLVFILLCNCSSTPVQDILPDESGDTTNSPTPPDNSSNGNINTDNTDKGDSNKDNSNTNNPQGDIQTSTSYDANRPVGFATIDTTPIGGEGGNSVVVTTDTELTTALGKSEKLIIYIQGTISTNSIIKVQAKNKTLLGLPGSALTNPNRTKASSGILYFKPGSDNLILRNITFKSAGAYDVDGNDNLCIDNTTNIWIDHCDFQDGVDGNFDCKNASDNIAVTWCRFRYLIEPLGGGSGGSDTHCYSNLWGSSDSQTQDRGHLNTTFQFCWWDEGCIDRMPRVRFGKIHIANCLYNSSVTSGCIGVGKEADIYVEKSAFIGIKKAHKTYNDDGKLRFDQCLFSNTPTDTGTDSSFTPTYTLETIPAEEVENVVSQYAGATLTITES